MTMIDWIFWSIGYATCILLSLAGLLLFLDDLITWYMNHINAKKEFLLWYVEKLKKKNLEILG